MREIIIALLFFGLLAVGFPNQVRCLFGSNSACAALEWRAMLARR